MNVFILVMLILSFLGLIDKMLNNKLGLEKAFDKGIQTMGTLALSMLGFYCIAVTLVGHHVDSITAFSQSLHIDPSIFISCLLAPDLGGFSIIHALTSHQGMLVLAGLVITSTIGTVISFQLPLFLTALEKDDISSFINGLIYGMIVMPCVFIPVGMILEIDHIFMILLPVFLICLILVAGLLFLQKTTMSFLLKFGEMIRILSLLFFLLVIVTCYCDHFHFTSMTLIQEGLMIVLKCSMIVSGSMILCELILKHFSRYIDVLSQRLGVNQYSIMGLFLQLASSVAMFPLFSKMDKKGKIINGAFSVSGAYALGAQLGFISSVADQNGVMIYLISKLVGGILAIILANYFYKEKASD